MRKFIKKADKEPTVTGIRLGVIVSAGKQIKRQYSANESRVGITVWVFSRRMKQEIHLFTSCPIETAKRLGLILKRRKQ